MNYQELLWEISQCKENLKATDYKAIKFAEGLITKTEYAPIKAQREEWRERINQYEALLPDAKAEWDARLIDVDPDDNEPEILIETDPDLFEREEDEDGMV